MRTGLAVLAVVLAGLVLVACAKVSDESYSKVKEGMSLSQVQGILGEGEKEEASGTSISAAGMAGRSSSDASRRQTYSWKDGDRQIIVEFADDKVVSKRKLGF
jgi:hypothetical protein